MYEKSTELMLITDPKCWLQSPPLYLEDFFTINVTFFKHRYIRSFKLCANFFDGLKRVPMMSRVPYNYSITA